MPVSPSASPPAPLPDSARYARDAAEAIGARFEDLDQGGGYLFRISKGERFVLAGAGAVCAFPVNSASAFGVSRDKAHTKSVLRSVEIPVIPGGLFFSHARQAALRGPGREAADALAFAARQGYPVFCKPNSGSRGNYAEIVRSEADLQDYLGRVARDFETFLIEPVVHGVEHRVLVHDGRARFHSIKSEPALIGDGRSTVLGLLAALNRSIATAGVSPYAPSALDDREDPNGVPALGVRIPMRGRRNLSAQGFVESTRVDVPARLAAIAIRAVAAIGLRLGAVDLFDLSTAGDLSDLVVIEVNGNPGLSTLERAGHMDVIRAIWVAMLRDRLEG